MNYEDWKDQSDRRFDEFACWCQAEFEKSIAVGMSILWQPRRGAVAWGEIVEVIGYATPDECFVKAKNFKTGRIVKVPSYRIVSVEERGGEG